LRRFVRQAIPASLKRPAKLQVCVGSPAKEILKAAARGVDLIVMATHGLTGAERLLLGSTTLSVLQRTPVPVLAVPPLVGDRASAIESWPGPCIVAACELDARTRGEADTAARVAEWLGATLVLAHVVPGIDAPAWLGGTLDGHDRIRIARAERLLDAAATVASRRVHTQAMVGCGRPADEIAALAADEGARLVVTTLRDRHGWFGARRGSVSHHVLTHAVVPVLACPASWRPR
jgi:nucleotide-binding universal stress UspA family protein